MNQSDVEQAVVRAFVIPEQQEKYLDGLLNPKRRSKILDRLHHRVDEIDPRIRIALPPDHHSAVDVERALIARGAGSKCYVISSSIGLDGREMLLSDALRAVIGYQMGTLISCIPGQLGFYESEEPSTRFILERRTTN